MAIKFLFILMTLSPYCLIAQQTSSFDPPSDEVMKTDCGGKMFTKVEQLPGFKISQEAYQDSLLVYLKSKNASIPEKKYTFIFVLTPRNEIFELGSLQGFQPGEEELYQVLTRSILDHARLFTPASQNGHIICTLAKFELDFKDKKLSARFFQ